MNMTVSVENRTTIVRRTVTAISVEDVEKRREPSKHYVSSVVVSFACKDLKKKIDNFTPVFLISLLLRLCLSFRF